MTHKPRSVVIRVQVCFPASMMNFISFLRREAVNLTYVGDSILFVIPYSLDNKLVPVLYVLNLTITKKAKRHLPLHKSEINH